MTSEQSAVDSYEYDLNGNMTCRVENGITFKQDYNAENRISAIHKMNGNCTTGTVTESWLYGYDGDGVRVSTAHYTGVTQDSLTLYYMGGAYEVTGSAVKKYYSMAGQTVMRDTDGSLKYLLSDHLGSTTAVVDGNGTLLSQQRYLPFGEPRTVPNSPIAGTDFTYTGQRMLDSGMGGIMDYRARFYSPALGRFLQPDSVIPNPANPQNLNRYSYVSNRPVSFNDPTGHIECHVDDNGDDYCLEKPKKRSAPTSHGGTPTPPPPTNTPPPTPSNTPVPTPTGPSILAESQNLVQESGLGNTLYDWAVNNGFRSDYSWECKGHAGGRKIYINPCESAVYNAGTIAHEIMHELLFKGSTGSQKEEYLAFLVGNLVRAELISKGHGTINDMIAELTDYTVNLDNPDEKQLEKDLRDWFYAQGLSIYVKPKPAGYGLNPFPLTFTPRPTITPTLTPAP